MFPCKSPFIFTDLMLGAVAATTQGAGWMSVKWVARVSIYTLEVLKDLTFMYPFSYFDNITFVMLNTSKILNFVMGAWICSDNILYWVNCKLHIPWETDVYRAGESRRTTILYAVLSRIGQLRDSGELIFTSNVTRMLRSASPAPCVRMCVWLYRRWRRETPDCACLSVHWWSEAKWLARILQCTRSCRYIVILFTLNMVDKQLVY